MANKIGPHTFQLIRGNIPIITQEIEVISKPGEDGHIRRQVGLRSPVFDLETQGTYATETAARNAFEVFGAMKTSFAVGLEKDTVDYDAGPTVPYEVQVLDVVQAELTKKACITGTTNRWLLRCVWTLILIPYT